MTLSARGRNDAIDSGGRNDTIDEQAAMTLGKSRVVRRYK